MKKKLMMLSAIAALSAGLSSQGAVVFTDNFESGLSNWVTNLGTPTTSATPTNAQGQSFVVTDGATTRILRDFGSSLNAAATSIKLTFDIYSNLGGGTTASPTSSRAAAGLDTSSGGVPSSGSNLARIGSSNNTDFIFNNVNGTTQTVHTNVPIPVQTWETVTLTYDLTKSPRQVTWTIGSQSGTITMAAAATKPTAVVLGLNVSNGTAGAPDSSVWFDNVKVEQFSPAAALTSAPSPSDGLINVNSTIPETLSWTGGANTTGYNVYLSTDANNLGTASSQTTTSKTVTGLLPATTYYWRVDSKDAVGDFTTGNVWSFTTASVPEPTSLGLIGAGLLGMMSRRKRA